MARLAYRLIGLRHPAPAVVAWRHVRAIDAMVHVDLDRHEAGLRRVDDACVRIVRRSVR